MNNVLLLGQIWANSFKMGWGGGVWGGVGWGGKLKKKLIKMLKSKFKRWYLLLGLLFGWSTEWKFTSDVVHNNGYSLSSASQTARSSDCKSNFGYYHFYLNDNRNKYYLMTYLFITSALKMCPRIKVIWSDCVGC